MAITSAPKRPALALRPTGRWLAQVARELATPRTLLVGGALVIVGYLAVVPLVYLLHDTFTGPGGLDLPRRPQDRPDQRGPVRTDPGSRTVQHLQHVGHDLGPGPAPGSDRLPAHGGGLPQH